MKPGVPMHNEGWIKCPYCFDGVGRAIKSPIECRSCEGNRRLWQYPSGQLALYRGGPFK